MLLKQPPIPTAAFGTSGDLNLLAEWYATLCILLLGEAEGTMFYRQTPAITVMTWCQLQHLPAEA